MVCGVHSPSACGIGFCVILFVLDRDRYRISNTDSGLRSCL